MNKESCQQRQCVLLLAHYLQDKVLEILHALQNDCVGKYDVWLLYDNSRQDFQPSLVHKDTRLFLFDLEIISGKYFMKSCDERGRIRDGNASFPIMEFYHRHPDYGHYWRIEYDVRFKGNWADLFDYFSGSNSDLLTTTLYRYAFRPEWMWWKKLKTPWYVRKVDGIRGFLPIARYSAFALDLLTRKYGKKWQGHDEAVVPTLLHHYGLTLEDIGGNGEFVDPQNRDRFYVNSPEKKGLAPGTMVCPPELPELPMAPGRIYHAIK